MAKGDLGLFLHMLSSSFEYQARRKQIEYEIDINMEGEAWYDEDIMEKIVINLLSNAFKYAPQNGKCWFTVDNDGDTVQISVKNTVSNSSRLQLDQLFVRFYQNDSYSEGVGVGLSLVKELVSFYGGSVNAVLEEEEIIHFEIRLPIQRGAFNTDDILGQSVSCKDKRLRELNVSNEINKQATDEELPILLLVEDHAEIRAFVAKALCKEYQILEAENGKIGLEMALAHIPDIVLSDIRMPLYNGIELCNTLKKDERTSHIPIVLLTANTSEENELKGLASGADDFVSKPFKIRILRSRIANLIRQRKILRERYSRELVLKPKEIAVTPADEAFLVKIQKILDEHLNDPSFTAAVFCEKAHMSRMQLHRKLVAYTGLSTSAFLRSQRLKLAEQLLQTSDMTINEVAYATGFNTPTYFMKCFKETFKKTPSGYLQSLSA
ncbi:MAG: response regulator [Pricia sp.]|nr:response regulator [Pricia sp.]